jgi:hypothetical protein
MAKRKKNIEPINWQNLYESQLGVKLEQATPEVCRQIVAKLNEVIERINDDTARR